MTFRSERPLDRVDWQLVEELQADARLSYKELGLPRTIQNLAGSGSASGYVAQPARFE